MRYHCLQILLLCLSAVSISSAQVPTMINYQGRVVVDGTNFTGNGQFKFAFVDSSGATSFWSHDGTSTSGSAPARHIVLPVSSGLYSVALGDSSVLNSAGNPMDAITPADLGNADLWLRIWFNDGQSGFQQLSPDQRITSVAYALVAESVPDGSITAEKLAPGVGAGGNLQASRSSSDATLLADGYLKINTIPAPDWQASSATGSPSERSDHIAVWTGESMLVWGGEVGTALSDQGGSYFPDTTTWGLLPSSELSPARSQHTGVWTGDRLIVWGGYAAGGESQSGAMYVPLSASSNPPVGGWLETSLTSAPVARSGHTAVWTGSEMLLWGGKNSGGVLRNGGAFTPPSGSPVPGVEGSWSGITGANSPIASHGHTAVWTGSRMLTWGGLNGIFNPLRAGGSYNPTSNAWTALPTIGAPSARVGHSAVWTGTRMIIFGGSNVEIPSSSANLLNDGAAYDPSTGAWTAISTTNAPSGRHRHQALWNGSEVLIIGGETFNGQVVTSGAAYNPATDTWRALPSTTETSAGQTALWTGSEVIIFGENGLLSLDTTPAVYLYAQF